MRCSHLCDKIRRERNVKNSNKKLVAELRAELALQDVENCELRTQWKQSLAREAQKDEALKAAVVSADNRCMEIDCLFQALMDSQGVLSKVSTSLCAQGAVVSERTYSSRDDEAEG
jgi:hypothetical protein